MPDLDRYLYDQLRSRAAAVDLHSGDVRGVMARGLRRRRRTRGAVAAATAAAVGTVSGVLVSGTGGGKPSEISVGSPVVPSATGTQLTWHVLPADAGLSGLASVANSGTAAYAVSTSPSMAIGADPTNQLYRTADGLSWTAATGPSGLSTAGVATDGNRVYTVGTAPATAATGGTKAVTTAVSWSDDGGGSWQKSVLPIELGAPAGEVNVNGENVDMVAGPKGVVASVTLNVNADISKLVPGVPSKALWTAGAGGVELLGSQVSSNCGVNAVENAFVENGSGAPLAGAQARAVTAKLRATARQAGVSTATASPTTNVVHTGTLKSSGSSGTVSAAPTGQVQGPVPCVASDGRVTTNIPADQAYKVTGTYTWSQLHIGGQLADALQGDPLMFYSGDGGGFRQVSLPAGTYASVLTATPDGFAMLASKGQEQTSIVLQSADGTDWTPTSFALPAAASGAGNIGYVGGHLIVLNQTDTPTATAFDLLAGGWHAVSLSVGLQQISFGPMGVAVVGIPGNGDSNSWQVAFSPDGLKWSSASLAHLSGGQVQDANVVVGSDQVVVTVTKQPARVIPGAKIPQVQLIGTSAG